MKYKVGDVRRFIVGVPNTFYIEFKDGKMKLDRPAPPPPKKRGFERGTHNIVDPYTARELRSKGLTYKQIGDQLGVSRQAIWFALKELARLEEAHPPAPAEGAEL